MKDVIPLFKDFTVLVLRSDGVKMNSTVQMNA